MSSKRNDAERLLRQLERAKESAGRLERLLLQSEVELRHAPEPEIVESFVEGMAVYFGNVFEAVTSYGKIIQMYMDHDDPLQTHAQLILDDAEAGKRLAHNLLRRKAAVSFGLLILDDFIRRLTPLLSRIVEKRIMLRTALVGPA